MALPVPLITSITPWMWLDADDATTITTSGSTLTGWRNKGSTGNGTFGSLSGAGTGTYNTVTANGRPLVSLNNRIFSTNAIIQTQQSYSVFAVYSIKSNYDTTGIDIIRPSDNASVGLLAGESSASTTSYGMRAANAGQANRLLGTSFNANSVGVKLGVFYNSTNTANSIITNNGAPLTLTTNIAASGANTTTAYTYNINPTANAVVDYAEILVYMGEITTAQRQSIEGYLAWKWGLQDSLPINHPNNPFYNKTQLLPLPVALNNDVLPWVWYDAADPTTITANQNTLVGWQNKGTSGSTAGGTVSGTITTGVSTLNGRNVITIGASSTFTTPSLTPTSQSWSAFFVNKSFANVGLAEYPSVFRNTNSGLPWIFFGNDNTYGYSIGGRDTVSNRVLASVSNRQNQTGLYSIINSTSTANNVIAINGTNQTLAISTAAGGTTLTATTYYMDLNSDIGELLVYMGEITTTQRYHIEGYLAWKWGLQTSLPATHPYHPTFKDSTMGLYVRPRYFVTTYAGLAGTSGTANDTTLALARFNNPSSICVDPSGNFYITDATNHAIRRISSAGTVSTFAGLIGSSGRADGTGATARFNTPLCICINPAGTTLYVSDTVNHRIRQIVISTQEVTTLAGPGPATAPVTGDTDGTGTAARFNSPFGITVHPTNGDVYVADYDNRKIRRVTSAGVVTTPYGPAQGTITSGATDATGNSARFFNPVGVIFDSNGTLFVSEGTSGNRKIRKIDLTTNAVTSFTGVANTQSALGYTDGFGADALFGGGAYMAIDSSNNIYLPDSAGHKIRKISPAGGLVTISGTAPTVTPATGTTNGMDTVGRFNNSFGITIYNNDLYVADQSNHCIRRLSLGATNQVGTYFTGRTLGTGITNDGFGNVYPFYDGNILTRLNIYGVESIFAGVAGSSSSTDGAGSAARFNGPCGSAVDYNNNIFVADAGGNRIRRISPAGLVTTYAGTGTASFVNGPGTTATFNVPRGVGVDPAGNVYVGDWDNEVVRKITQSRMVTTFAGSGAAGTSDGSGNRYAATFTSASCIVNDSEGNLYIVDRSAQNIRRITSAGVFSNFAGSGTASSVDGTGTSATFNNPECIYVDKNDNLYIIDILGQVVRRITPSAVVTTIAGLAGATGSTDAVGSLARFTNPYGITIDSAGNMFLTDRNFGSIRCIRFYNPGRPVVTSQQPLTATSENTAITDRNTGIAFTYQWYKSDAIVDTYSTIGSATSINYIPSSSEVNTNLRVYASYTNTVGSTVATRSDPVVAFNTIIPGTPTLASARPFAGDGIIRFNWTDQLFTSSITVICNGTNAGTRVFPPNTGQTTYTGLTNGNTYSTIIIATNNGGVSSLVASYRDTQPGFLPSAPTNASFSVVNSNQLRVKWSPPAEIGQSPIGWYVITSSDNVYKFGLEGFRREFVSPPLPAGNYTFSLRAINSMGYGAPVTNQITI
jgi:sugar lactone lactonase YvrE